jgi:putative nucleotidyltransferase with HDIG domain
MDKVQKITKEIIKKLASSLQTVSVYDFDHPSSKKAVEDIYKEFQEGFLEAEHIDFGIANKELFSRKHIYFDLIVQTQDFVRILESKGIDYLKFKRGLTKDELVKFLVILKEKRLNQEDIAKGLNEKGLIHISTQEFGQGGTPEKHQQKESKGFVDIGKFYDQYVDKLKYNIDTVVDSQGVDLKSLMEISSNMLNLLIRHQKFFFFAMNIKQHDDYTFAHCLNVSALTMFQARQIGLPQEWVLKTGVAGFLHDIGKFAIHNKIINKEGTLSEQEMKIIKNHASYGAKMLLRKSNSSKLSIIASFQHHMGVSLKGYPKADILKKQHLISELVSISDVYDALRTRRSYRGPMPLTKVYEIMQKEKGRLFSQDLADWFLKNIGVWPVGTLVKLNTGQIGLVVKNNSEDVFHPQVRVIYDSSGKKIEDKIIKDLTCKDSEGNFITEISKQIVPTKEDQLYIEELFA